MAQSNKEIQNFEVIIKSFIAGGKLFEILYKSPFAI